MTNLSEVQRVVCRHDWQCLGEWPHALGELANLSDDEIEGLARSDQQRDTPSSCNGYSLPAAVNLQHCGAGLFSSPGMGGRSRNTSLRGVADRKTSLPREGKV